MTFADPKDARPPRQPNLRQLHLAAEPRMREPSLAQRMRGAPVTSAIIVANVVVFIVAESQGSTRDTGTLLSFGAGEAMHVWAGEWWRLITPTFLHIGVGHLVWNAYAAFGWCTVVERALGGRRFAIAYVLSGIGASAASVALQRVVSAGASGAAFGVVGITLVLLRRAFGDWTHFFGDRGVRATLASIALWIGLGFVLPMDQFAHLGGFATGAIFGWIVTGSPPKVRSWSLFAAAFICLVAAATKPWGWRPTPADAPRLAAFARAYATGRPNGKSFPTDQRRAARFFGLACDADDQDACVAYGRMLYDGVGVAKDANSGLAKVRGACDRGNRAGCDMLESITR
jgi:membrane associated rhomboid family serine protease